MVELVDSKPWAPMIGRLILAFGRIERTTHECIRDWAGAKIHKHFAQARLSARINLAIDLAESRDAAPKTKQAFTASLLQAKNLAKHRNLVAHNPLCLLLLQDNLDSPFLEAISSNIDCSKHMSFEELTNIVEEVELCEKALLDHFIAFRVESIDLKLIKRFPGLGRNGA